MTEERYSAAVEIAAYLLVVEAVDDAAARHATLVDGRDHSPRRGAGGRG